MRQTRTEVGYIGLVRAGLVPEVREVLDAHDEAMHPHEFDTHSRLFDVTLENGPIDRYMNFTFSIVANSFLQAQTTAVKRANARLAAYKAAFEAGHFVGDDCGEPLSLVEFSPAHVVKMEVVRSQVAIFRHEK